MSGATRPSRPSARGPGATADRLRAATDRLRAATAGGVRAAAFWCAVLLPAVYLPAVSLLDGPAGLLPACLALNAGCAALGHEYRAEAADATGATDETSASDAAAVPDGTADAPGGVEP